MDLATATPAEIDTELARLYHQRAAAETEIDRAQGVIEMIENAPSYATPYKAAERVAAAKAAIETAGAEIRAARQAAAPLEAAYAEKRWPRYYLVTNTGGHVHTSRSCSTCFVTTEYAWLTEQSGMSAEALVELAGEAACTVCFPWAPVNTLNRPSKLEAPERKAAREAREAEKAARTAKKIEKGLTADGSEFVVTWYADAMRYVRVAGRTEHRLVQDAKHTESFKTERAAVLWYVNQHADAAVYQHTAAELPAMAPAFEAIEQAVAAKHGKTVEQVKAELTAKVDAKVKRDAKEREKYQRSLGL